MSTNTVELTTASELLQAAYIVLQVHLDEVQNAPIIQDMNEGELAIVARHLDEAREIMVRHGLAV